MEEFPEVFEDGLLGLCPSRKVKFSIELEIGIASNHKAPCRMMPSKLKELKFQLQELLAKGFH